MLVHAAPGGFMQRALSIPEILYSPGAQTTPRPPQPVSHPAIETSTSHRPMPEGWRTSVEGLSQTRMADVFGYSGSQGPSQ